jgi:membrane protein DedA with SNARE-associated domain
MLRVTATGFRRFSALAVFLFPGAIVCALAGASRMRVRWFFVLNLAGTLAVVLALRAFASVFRGPIEDIQQFNDRNFRWLTAVTIVAVVLYILWQRRQLRRRTDEEPI